MTTKKTGLQELLLWAKGSDFGYRGNPIIDHALLLLKEEQAQNQNTCPYHINGKTGLMCSVATTPEHVRCSENENNKQVQEAIEKDKDILSIKESADIAKTASLGRGIDKFVEEKTLWREAKPTASEGLIKQIRAYVNNDASYDTWKKDIEAILSRHIPLPDKEPLAVLADKMGYDLNYARLSKKEVMIEVGFIDTCTTDRDFCAFGKNYPEAESKARAFLEALK